MKPNNLKKDIEKFKLTILEFTKNAKLSALTQLLSKPIPINIGNLKYKQNQTLLHVLSYYCTPSREISAEQQENVVAVFGPLVSLLIFHGVSLHDLNDKKESCLHIAAKKSSANFISILLKRGASPYLKSRSKKNILHYAAQNHDPNVWTLLLSSLREPMKYITSKNRRGLTPCMLASLKGNATALAAMMYFYKGSLLEELRLEPPRGIPPTKLEGKVSRIPKPEDATTIELSGATLNSLFAFCPALMINMNRNCLKRIFTNLTPSQRDTVLNSTLPQTENTWLQLCANMSSEDTILTLLDFNPRVTFDKDKQTPLHTLIRRGMVRASISILSKMPHEMLLELDSNNRSILHHLASFATTGSPSSLFSAVQTTSYPPNSMASLWHYLANTPFNYSSGNNFGSISSTVNEQNSFDFHSISAAPHNMSILHTLLSSDRLNAPDLSGSTPIHILVRRDAHGMATELFCKWAPHHILFAVDHKGRTALHLSVKQPHSLEVLLDYLSKNYSSDSIGGSNVLSHSGSSLASTNTTSSSISFSKSDNNNSSIAFHNVPVIELHNESIQDILDQKDNLGHTALVPAVKAGAFRSIQLLLDFGASTNSAGTLSSTLVQIAAESAHLMVLAQLIDNLVCTYDEAKASLVKNGFRSSLPEFDSLLSSLDLRYKQSGESSSGGWKVPSFSAGYPSSAPTYYSSSPIGFKQPYPHTLINTDQQESPTLMKSPIARNKASFLPSFTTISPEGSPNSSSINLVSPNAGVQSEIFPHSQLEINDDSFGECAPRKSLTPLLSSTTPPDTSVFNFSSQYTSFTPAPLEPPAITHSRGVCRDAIPTLNTSSLTSHSSHFNSEFSSSSRSLSFDGIVRKYDNSKPFILGMNSPRENNENQPDSLNSDQQNFSQPRALQQTRSPSGGYSSEESSIGFEIRIRPGSTPGSLVAGGSSTSVDSLGSDNTSESSLDSPRRDYSIPQGRTNFNRSLSTSPPRNGGFSWGSTASSPPTSTPMSPHLSPRNSSPRSRGPPLTPASTPNSPSLDRMRLQRSLSPRSLPTIREVTPSGDQEPCSTPSTSPKLETPTLKATTSKRNLNGSGSSLKRTLLMNRSRSLKELPTPENDFILAYIDSGGMGPSGSLTSPISTPLAGSSPSVHMSHSRSRSDHLFAEDKVKLVSKKRAKSVGKKHPSSEEPNT